MKYKKQVAIALLCFTSQGHGNNVYSHTFFSAIPQQNLVSNLTENLLVDQAHNEGRALKRRTVQITAFGGKSFNTEGLRDYFFYEGRESLRMKETPDLQGGTANNLVGNGQELIGSDFNIQTLNGAQSTEIFINPKQTFSGASLSFRVPVLERFWATLEIPVVHVKNNLDLVETASYTPLFAAAQNAVGFWNEQAQAFSRPVPTMVQAFQQNGMLYGRITGAQTVTRVADLNFKFGMDFVDQNDLYMSGYAGKVLPTGNRPEGVYVFEAIAGNNHHTGLIGGFYGQYSFENAGHGHVWLGWLFEGQYLFKNTQKRSFDLNNRPWSRYLQVFWNESARQDEIAAGGAVGNPIVTPFRTWGINYFTQEMTVHPGYNGNFDININYVGDAWHTGCGLNTYVRQAELVQLKHAWNNQGVQIAGLPIYNKPVYASATIAGATDTLRTIGNLDQAASMFIANGATPVYVLDTDLDLGSAAHPAVYSQTLYASFGYYNNSTYPQNFELGASYEFSSTNTTLHRWGIWSKVQITF